MTKVITINDVSHEEYLKKTEWLSASKMMYIKTPAQYIYNVLNKKEETEAMLIGKAFHCLVLKPELFEDNYPCLLNSSYPVQIYNDKSGTINLQKKENQQHKKLFYTENEGKSVITEAQLEQIKEMKQACLDNIKMNNFSLQEIIDKSDVEIDHEAYFIVVDGEIVGESDLKQIEKEQAEKLNPDTVIKVRLRTDIDCEELKILMDLKSTKSANREDFARTAYQADLPIQAAMYLDILSFNKGIEYDHFFYPVVEKTEPYLTDMFYCSKEYLEYGKRMYKKRLIALKEAILKKEFKGFEIFHEEDETATELWLPNYVFNHEKMEF